MDEVPKNKLDRYGWYITIASTVWPIIQAVLICFFAGRIDLLRPWLYAAIGFLVSLAGTAAVACRNPELLNHRGRWKQKKDAQTWDKIIVRLFGWFGYHLPAIIAGLDLGRYHWSVLPMWTFFLGTGLFIAGNILLYWAMLTNTHFEAMVRLQTDRHHQVVTGGPYRFVRHPGYVGVLAWMLAMPLTWGSAVSLIPAVIGCALLVVRTYKEDTLLQKDLAGYKEFTHQTPYRLIPGIW